MLDQLKSAADRTLTENGAVTHRSTGSQCLDLFAAIGALRGQEPECVEGRFVRAYCEDADLAMKILFYARDIRGGLGERQVFRTLLVWLAHNEKPSLVRNLPYVPEYGRWDDVLVLLDTPAEPEAVALLRGQFEADRAALESGGEVSLLGKWLPSVNASNAAAAVKGRRLAKAFGLRESAYRKALTALRGQIRIIENHLRQVDYRFDYSKQPSRAMFQYRRAFLRHDRERYQAFLDRVSTGESRLHTGALMPYDIVNAARTCTDGDRQALDVTWRALEDFTGDDNAIVVADGSASMTFGTPKPLDVAQSLAIYFAERNRGAFHKHFITFSTHPRLVEIKGRDIAAKVRYCTTFHEVADTNLEAVFALILSAAVEHKLPQWELPSTIYIISDMEFNFCVEDASLTNFQNAKRMFRSHGYDLPHVVFWNVDARGEQVPVKQNEQGVVLVSGFTPRIFAQVLSGDMDPYRFMMQVIGAERYAPIRA